MKTAITVLLSALLLITGGIANAQNIEFVGSCELPGASAVMVSGDYAYVACNNSGLQIFDISNPAEPSWIGEYDLGYAEDVFISGNYAYVAGRYLGLRIVDISDPTEPTWVGEYETSSPAFGVFVSGDFAYVACGDEVFGGWGGLQIIDISIPFQPVFVGEYGGGNELEWSVAFGVFISGEYAYLAWNDFFQEQEEVIYIGRLIILEVSDPEQPNLVGWSVTRDGAIDVFVSNEYAYVADGRDGGLGIIDISDPTNPERVGEYLTPGDALGVHVSGDHAYLADGRNGGLQIIEIGDPAQPMLVDSYDTPGVARSVFVSGEYVFVAVDYSLIILRFDPETGIAEEVGKPVHFSLSQNYPNPFNASTSISFALPQPGDVRLVVYDLLGRQVETILDESRPAGHHQIIYDASSLSSGVYFYQIKTGDLSETKRMLLLK